MNKERAVKTGLQEIDTNSSQIVTCRQEEAKKFVQKLLVDREQNGEKIVTLVLDGAIVKPQKNIAEIAIEYQNRRDHFSVDYKNYHVEKSVYAGFFVAILEKTIEEEHKWSSKLKISYDSSWEEKVARSVAKYPWTEADKISEASPALEYIHNFSEKFGFQTPNLIILNFDRTEHPCYGPRFNPRLANDLIKFGYDTNVLLFVKDKRNILINKSY